MTADLLRRAAAKLRDPLLCNWDRETALALADWLDAEADGHAAVEGVGNVVGALMVEMSATEFGAQIKHSTMPQALAVARAVLREDQP